MKTVEHQDAMGLEHHPSRRNRTMRNWGFRLTLTAIVFALLSPILGTAALNFGIWHQVAPVLMGLMLAGALALFGLCFMCLSRSRLVSVGIFWIALPSFLIVGLAILTLGYAEFPGRVLFGSPQLAEGAIWYFILGSLAIGTVPIWRHTQSAVLVASIATIVNFFIALLTNNPFQFNVANYVPLFFPDYLAFAVFFAMAAVASLYGRISKVLILGLIGLGAGTVVLSNNNSAIGLLALSPIVFGAAWLFLQYFNAKSARWVAITSIVTIAIVITLTIWKVDFAPLVTDGDLIARLANSVVSRHHLAEIVERAIVNSPEILLFGQGFGTFTDSFAAHLPVNWVNLRDDAVYWNNAESANMAAAHWDAILRVDFHSHNYLIDHLLYNGIFGLSLILAFFVWPIWICRKNQLPLVITTSGIILLISTVWFMPPQLLALHALWLGTVRRDQRAVRRTQKPSKSRVRHRRIGIAILSIAGASLLIGGSYLSTKFAVMAHSFNPLMATPIETTSKSSVDIPRPNNCLQQFHDLNRGGIHLAHRIDNMSNFVRNTTLQQGTPETSAVQALTGLYCAALTYAIDAKPSIQLKIALIRSMGDLAFLPRLGDLDILFKTVAPAWPIILNDTLLQASQRTDLAATYLLYLLANNDQKAFAAEAQKLYQISPSTPVSQWFYGVYLLESVAPDAGLALMKDALTNGVERFIPVEPTLKAQILGEVHDTTSTLPVRRLSILTDTGTHTVNAEIASTEDQRAFGLKGRLSLPHNSGMLLVFDAPQLVSISMQDTFISLDLLFIGENGRIIEIVQGTLPQSGVAIGPVDGTSFVLEVNAGFVSTNNVQIGDLIRY